MAAAVADTAVEAMEADVVAAATEAAVAMAVAAAAAATAAAAVAMAVVAAAMEVDAGAVDMVAAATSYLTPQSCVHHSSYFSLSLTHIYAAGHFGPSLDKSELVNLVKLKNFSFSMTTYY